MKILKEGSSWTEAYPILSKIINEKNFKIGAEIGVAYGGHAEYILSHTKIEKLYGVDPYKHIWGYNDPMNFYFWKFNKLYKSMLSRLSVFGNRFVIIRKKSKDATNDITEKLDFVYIDADHSYDGVKNDIERWFCKVKPTGIIAGHDYNHPNFPGVTKAVDGFFQKINLKINHDKSGVWWVEKKQIPVSFIIPAFNCEDTIKESIFSILYGNFEEGDEIIIVNDGSTDNTLKTIEDISKLHSSIKIINHTNNLGGGAARNTAVKNSHNDLIFCLDSDNILEKGSVGKLKYFLISNGGDVASFGGLKFFKKSTNKITHEWKFSEKEYIDILDLLCSPIVPPSSGNYLFTKKSWINAGGYPEKAGALDAWGFGFKQLATNSVIKILPESYYFHRHGHNSYWVRESFNNDTSAQATEIIKPYFNLINKDIVTYIQKNKNTWFDNIGNIPNVDCNNQGKLLVPFKKLPVKKIMPLFMIKIFKKIYLYIDFINDFFVFKKKSKGVSRFKVSWKNRYPKIFDKTVSTDFDAHYIYHPAWAARIISETKPKKHIDISSLLHFSTLVSAFIPVEFYDYRPAKIKLKNLLTKRADLMCLPFKENSVESLSCMHTVEHIGLGRYGDPIDPNGDLKAMEELSRVLARGGNLLLVTPIGKPALQFNAHRIYSYDQIISYFPDLTLKEFSLLVDGEQSGGITYNASKELADTQNYGCGCFWFTKD